MKKIFFFILLFSFLFSNNCNQLIKVNGVYVLQKNFDRTYIDLLAYNQTLSLIKAIDNVLSNEKLKHRIHFDELGNVKYETIDLLVFLKKLLIGWKKYTNTYFDNNSNLAGIKKILKENYENDVMVLNVPLPVTQEIKKSLSTLTLNNYVKKLKYEKDPRKAIKIILMLLDNYYSTLSQLNIPLLKKYNSKIKDELERNYRIYATAPLLNTIKAIKETIKNNYIKIYERN